MRVYSIANEYISNVGSAMPGTDLIEHNGNYFLPLDSGAVLPITPAQLKSDFVEYYEYPDWMDAATAVSCRIAANPTNGGMFIFSIEVLDGSYLDHVPYVEINGRKFKKV